MKIFAFLVSLLLLALPAASQTEVSAVTSFGFGTSESQGTFFEVPQLGLTLNRFWTENWSTELGLYRSEGVFATIQEGPPSETHRLRQEVYPITGIVQYHFFDNRWRPYLGAGLIYARSPGDPGNATLVDDEDVSRFIWNAGITYALTPRLGLRLDLKYAPHAFDGPPLFDEVTPTLGLKVRF